jgi:hypothetical protein
MREEEREREREKESHLMYAMVLARTQPHLAQRGGTANGQRPQRALLLVLHG